MPINIQFDADEGRYITVCCLSCHKDNCNSEEGILEIAHQPVIMYDLCIACRLCGEEIVRFHQFERYVISPMKLTIK